MPCPALPVPGSPSPAGTGSPIPLPRTSIPAGNRRCPTHPRPERAAVPARVSPTAVTACPQRRDGTGGPCWGRGPRGPHAGLVPGMSRCGRGKPHGTPAGGMSLRGDAPGWRAGWRPVPALFIYFFTHRVINLCVPGRKARGGGGGPCRAAQPACPGSGPPRKSPGADPGEMLSLPTALLWQKAVGQRVQNHRRDGAAMPFQQAEPVRQGRAGWALPGQWGQDTPPDTPRGALSCTSKAFIAQIRARLKES